MLYPLEISTALWEIDTEKANDGVENNGLIDKVFAMQARGSELEPQLAVAIYSSSTGEGEAGGSLGISDKPV